MNGEQAHEPDFNTASQWWPDLENIWTPIGWRDHLFRFNVLYNGTILAQPHMNRRTEKYKGFGLQLGFTPATSASYDDYWSAPFMRHDDGQVLQGWQAHDTPVMWTEWSHAGVLLRQYVFAHVPGGQETQTGDEPLFAWIRLTVHYMTPALPLEDRHGLHLLFNRPYLFTNMAARDNIRDDIFWHKRDEPHSYPKMLRAEGEPERGLRILEEDGKVRLAMAPGASDVNAEFFSNPRSEDRWPAQRLYVELAGKEGASVDILLPMLPTDRKTFDRELALGYHRALEESAAYWKAITATSARFVVPEAPLNQALAHSVRFSNVLTERNPQTGKLCKVNGSWTYADLWTTPGAMDTYMMDLLGHHAMVARYLEILRDEQGTVTPPGDVYSPHPGYLSTPALYKSIDWLSDHGAILWMICNHYLLSGDRVFLTRYQECLIKACEWIKYARALTGHGGYEGVLPPAVATDSQTKIQAIWSIGWNYKGLSAAVRILNEIGHPRAGEFAQEAEDYRADFLKALRHKCAGMPTWTDSQGRERRFVPTALAGDEKKESRHAFYLDTGPLFLVFAGLLPASDPLMQDTLAWFREGPQHALYRRDTHCWQVPVLDHEMSSCEPIYSWNVFHAWQLADRERFLECLYSVFAGALSRKTRISCETRGGITGNVFSASLASYLARLCVIDDQICPGELHLLRLMPKAWLRPGNGCTFENMPTEFGPVSVQTDLSANGQELAVKFTPQFRGTAPKVLMHVPEGISRVVVNGRGLAVDKGIIPL